MNATLLTALIATRAIRHAGICGFSAKSGPARNTAGHSLQFAIPCRKFSSSCEFQHRCSHARLGTTLPQSARRGLRFAPGGWPDGLPSLLRAWWVGSTEHPVPYRLAGPSMDQRPSRLSSLGIHLDGADHNPLTTLCCTVRCLGVNDRNRPGATNGMIIRAKSTTFVTHVCHELEQAGKSDSAASRTL